MLSGLSIALDDRQDAGALSVLRAIEARPQVENLRQQCALNISRCSRMLRFAPDAAAQDNGKRTGACQLVKPSYHPISFRAVAIKSIRIERDVADFRIERMARRAEGDALFHGGVTVHRHQFTTLIQAHRAMSATRRNASGADRLRQNSARAIAWARARKRPRTVSTTTFAVCSQWCETMRPARDGKQKVKSGF
jgi:hypothetical protein